MSILQPCTKKNPPSPPPPPPPSKPNTDISLGCSHFLGKIRIGEKGKVGFVGPLLIISSKRTKWEISQVFLSRIEANDIKKPLVINIVDGQVFWQVSADELERRRIRRERNKVAASKCRKKRKEHVKTLVEVKTKRES